MDIKQYMTKDTLAMLGILAVLVVCTTVLIYLPQSRKLGAIRTETAKAKTDLDSTARKAAIVPAMVEQVEQMRRRYDKDWDTKLPRQTELGEFVRQVSHFRDTSGLRGQNIEPSSPEHSELYRALPVVVQCKGSFGSFGRFLERIEAMERLVRVQQMSIEADVEQSPATVDVTLRMSIYNRTADL